MHVKQTVQNIRLLFHVVQVDKFSCVPQGTRLETVYYYETHRVAENTDVANINTRLKWPNTISGF